MTNEEILQASLLDIIFENRNKDYGAYALRQTYNRRLLIALGTIMSAILFLNLISRINKKEEPVVSIVNTNGGIEIRQIELPKPPEKFENVNIPKPVQKLARVQYVNVIKIKPDNQVKTSVPDIKELEGKIISTQTLAGKTDDGIVKSNDNPVSDPGNDNNVAPAQSEPEFTSEERDPEFPGGPDALKRFLAKNLNAPDQLEIGERKMVQIRFWVNMDGVVSTLEILNSGGNEFDREVMRVCKKMPRWKPAIRNGINIPVSYLLPVTFIGAEQ